MCASQYAKIALKTFNLKCIRLDNVTQMLLVLHHYAM